LLTGALSLVGRERHAGVTLGAERHAGMTLGDKTG